LGNYRIINFLLRNAFAIDGSYYRLARLGMNDEACFPNAEDAHHEREQEPGEIENTGIVC